MKKALGIFTFLFISCFVYATHEVGGYISLKCLGGTTYEVSIITYTNTANTTADRDTMRIYWGDGHSDVLSRVNGKPNYLIPNDFTPNGEPLCDYDFGFGVPKALTNARKLNIYTGTHTYPGPGSYTLATDDPDRMASINNITGSVNVDFFLFNTLTISPLSGCVNTPVITNSPVCQYGCTGQCYTYNPGAYIPTPPSDVDDSIAYALGSSLQWYREIAQGYSNEGATVNSTTGTLTWCPTSSQQGKWNFVILMVTWSKVTLDGEKVVIPIDTTELELEVIIDSACLITAPTVTTTNTCVIAGSNIKLDFQATDAGKTVYVTDAGEPFSLSPPATLTNDAPAATVRPVFNWQTVCSEVRQSPYEVLLTATEKNFQDGDSIFLSSYGASYIRVIGPPPPHLFANVDGTTACLHWDPSPCPQATGYNIYRGLGCISFKPDMCTTGVPVGSGFTLIASTTGLNDTTYCDSNSGAGLSPNVHYSYIVDATYPLPDGSQSIASNDTCVFISLSVPVITNVSVTKTDPADGEMFVRWMKPLIDSGDLDTSQFPPPYSYVLERASDMHGLNFKILKTFTSTVYNTKGMDTTYTDAGIDTQDSSYNYRVQFYYTSANTHNLTFLGSSGTASSIYLRLQKEDKSMKLGWSSTVPWANDTFFVYRQNVLVSPAYNFIKYVTGLTTYTDTGLHNGTQYCYYVKSSSHYGDIFIMHPLYDSSETICGTPYDTVAPCAPSLSVSAKCVLYEDSILWTNPNTLCPKANKVISYQVFYTPVENGDMVSIATLDSSATFFVNSNLTSVAGCYAVIAYDSAGQGSPLNTICVDNCPIYVLPNVFTPGNGDINSLFTPLEPFRYVQSIDINIYNRWGQVMFHTTNPKIDWNGTDEHSNQPCPDGVYYYICQVNEIRLTGIVPVTLKGFVQLIR
ncbi:MAG TPA: gliding motility-associated C-terminal domain-containing protein [Bacteroidia bacterium]|nr:gliding motility-associated C-terminal domain-containing protein [Bacteroidia bacterium]